MEGNVKIRAKGGKESVGLPIPSSGLFLVLYDDVTTFLA